MRTAIQSFGIRAVQFSLLGVVDRLVPATRAEIARNQKLDQSTLTRDLKSIFSQGWVEEVRQGADGRRRPIALTAVGKQLLLEPESAWRAAQDEVKALLRQNRFIAE